MRGDTLFVSDLDFTLLRSDGTLSPRSAEVLNGLIADGLQFTYATARSFRSSRRVTRDLRLSLPVVTYGGTVVADPDDGMALRVDHMPTATVEPLLRAAKAVAVEPILFTMEDGRDRIRWMADAASDGVRSFVAKREADPRLGEISSWETVDHETVFYVTMIASRPKLEAVIREASEAVSACAVFLSRDGYTGEQWLEIHAPEGTKARSARRVADDVGATRLVAFGDNLNDVPLFEIADEGCAVAGAVPELRDIATRTIGSNDEDAVALWLAENSAN